MCQQQFRAKNEGVVDIRYGKKYSFAHPNGSSFIHSKWKRFINVKP